ncbi:unnamed protein product, partial [Closterium sp. NIES-64]
GASWNNFSGSIPSSITRLSQLSVLNFDHTLISGPIPSFIGALKNLDTLSISHSSMSGTIPSTISGLSSLSSLDAANTRLSGTIPSTVGQLASLVYLTIANTNVSGPLPASLGALPKLSKVFIPGGVTCGRAGSSCEIQQNASSFFCQALCFKFCTSCIPLNGEEVNGSSSLCLLLAAAAAAVVAAVYVKRGAQGTELQPLAASASRVFGRARCPKFPVSLVAQATGGWTAGGGGARFGASYNLPLYPPHLSFLLGAPFPAQVATLWSIRHTNLQPLLGYCWEKRGSDSPAADAAAVGSAERAGADAATSHPVEQAEEEQVLVFEWVPGGNLHSRLVAGASTPGPPSPQLTLSMPIPPTMTLPLSLPIALQPLPAQHMVSRNITANLRAAHLPSAPDAIVLPMVRLALSCTASDPLSRPTVTDLLRSIKALKRSLSAHPRPALPANVGTSRGGDMHSAAGGGDAAEQQGGEHGDVFLEGFSQNALDAKLDWLLEEEDSGRFVADL